MNHYRILQDQDDIYVQVRLWWFWHTVAYFDSEYEARCFVKKRWRPGQTHPTVIYDTQAPHAFAKLVKPVEKKEEPFEQG